MTLDNVTNLNKQRSLGPWSQGVLFDKKLSGVPHSLCGTWELELWNALGFFQISNNFILCQIRWRTFLYLILHDLLWNLDARFSLEGAGLNDTLSWSPVCKTPLKGAFAPSLHQDTYLAFFHFSPFNQPLRLLLPTVLCLLDL